MGYGDNSSSSSSSTSGAIAPPAVSAMPLKHPQDLLNGLRIDFVSTLQSLHTLTRTQVRELLSAQNLKNHTFYSQLFKMLIQIFDPKAVELKVNITSVKIGTDITKETAIGEMMSGGMLQHKTRTFGSDWHEYPIYDHEKDKTQQLIVYSDNMTAYHEKHAQIAYDAFLQRKYIQENLPEFLSQFLKKSNQPIADALLFPELATLLIKLKNWDLLAELLLRMEKENTWLVDKSPFIEFINQAEYYASLEESPETLAYKRCAYILRERTNHFFRQNIIIAKLRLSIVTLPDKFNPGWSLANLEKACSAANTIYELGPWDKVLVNIKESDRPILPQIMSSTTTCLDTQQLAQLFSRLARIDRAAMLLRATQEEKNIFLSHADLSKPDPTLQFFNDFFSDVFAHTAKNNFTWLTCIDLNSGLDESFDSISARFSQIIEWEMFDAVDYLLQPLKQQACLNLIGSFNAKAWDLIIEFPADSKNLVDRIVRILLESNENIFSAYIDNSAVDILSRLLQLNRLADAQALYIKFNLAFKAKGKYISSVQALLDQTENQIEKQITDNYQSEITCSPLLLERKLKAFIDNPEAFIHALNTHLILAHKYFKHMSEEDKKVMIINAQKNKVRLLEAVYELNALSFSVNQPMMKIQRPSFNTWNAMARFSDVQGNPLINRLSKNDRGDKFSFRNIINRNNYWSEYSRDTIVKSDGKYYLEFPYAENSRILFHIFLDYDYREPATKEIILSLLPHLPVASSLSWPDEDTPLTNIFIGLITNQNNELIRLLLTNSDVKIVRRLFTAFIGKNSTCPNTYPPIFMSWLLQNHQDDYPITMLFKSLSLDLIKGFINNLDPHYFKSILNGLLESHNLSDHNKQLALTSIVSMQSPLEFIDMIIDEQILKTLLLPENLIYAKALHSLAPDYFKEHYVQFHFAITESNHDKFDNELIAKLNAIRQPQFASPVISAPQAEAVPAIPHNPPPPYSSPVVIEPEPRTLNNNVLLNRIGNLELQLAQQSARHETMMLQLINALQSVIVQPIDNRALLQAQDRIHELEVEMAQRALIEATQKQTEERRLKNMLRFSQVPHAGESARKDLKRTGSLSQLK